MTELDRTPLAGDAGRVAGGRRVFDHRVSDYVTRARLGKAAWKLDANVQFWQPRIARKLEEDRCKFYVSHTPKTR
jgi:hypothetical protein